MAGKTLILWLILGAVAMVSGTIVTENLTTLPYWVAFVLAIVAAVAGFGGFALAIRSAITTIRAGKRKSHGH